MKNIKLGLKSRRQLIEMILNCDGDILDEENSFYLSCSSQSITVTGYCDEEKAFTCKEFPEYAFPIQFISHVEKKSYKIDAETTFLDIASVYACTSENIRKIYKKAMKTLGDITAREEEFWGDYKCSKVR